MSLFGKAKKNESAQATAEALRQERPAAEAAIETARAELGKVRFVHDAAFAEFRKVENEATEKQLWIAQQRVRGRELDLAESEAALATLDGAVETAVHAEREQTKAELEQKLASDPIGDALLTDAAHGLLAVVDKMSAIREHNIARQAIKVELESVRLQLGFKASPFTMQSIDVEPHLVFLRERALELVGQLGVADEPRRRFIQMLVGP